MISEDVRGINETKTNFVVRQASSGAESDLHQAYLRAGPQGWAVFVGLYRCRGKSLLKTSGPTRNRRLWQKLSDTVLGRYDGVPVTKTYGTLHGSYTRMS